MNTFIKKYILILMISLLYVNTAEAGLIKWVLDDVVFNDQSTATGSYFYGADTNTFSNINITTSTSGDNYTVVHPNSSGNSSQLILLTEIVDDFTGVGELTISLASIMTNAGGSITIVPDIIFGGGTGFSFEATCFNVDCGSITPLRGISSGSVTTNVPEPSALAIFVLGIIGLACYLCEGMVSK